MAELAKKLRLQNTQGILEVCTLYTTREEANTRGGVLSLTVDGVNCFAALGELNDSEATKGRVEKNGRTLAILRRGTLPPGSITYDFIRGVRRHTFTVPLGVRVLRISTPRCNPDAWDDRDSYYMPATPGETLSLSMDEYGEEGSEENPYYLTYFVGRYTFDIYQPDYQLVLSWSEEINHHATKAMRVHGG